MSARLSACPARRLCGSGARAIAELAADRSARGASAPSVPCPARPHPAQPAASMGAAAVRWHLCLLLALGARGRLVGASGLPGKPEDPVGDEGARGPTGCHLAPSEAALRRVLPPCKVTSASARGARGRRGRGGLRPREGKREAGGRKEARRPPAGPGMRTETGGDPQTESSAPHQGQGLGSCRVGDTRRWSERTR